MTILWNPQAWTAESLNAFDFEAMDRRACEHMAKFYPRTDIAEDQKRAAERQKRINAQVAAALKAEAERNAQVEELRAKAERERKRRIKLGILRPTADSILREVAAKHKVTVEAMCSNSRAYSLAHARQEVYYRLRTELNWSYPQIGRKVGGRDHTTAIHGHRQYEKRLVAARRVKYRATRSDIANVSPIPEEVPFG